MVDKRVPAHEHEQERKNLNASFAHLPGTEIVERRGKFVKHYDLGGGRYQMVVFPEPVHFEQNGKWAEIDNTLVESIDTEGNAILRNIDSPLLVELTKEIGDNPLIRMTAQGKTISWTIANQQVGCIARIVSPSRAVTPQDERIENHKEFTQVIYEGIRADMDIVYTMQGDQFKEDIVIHSANAAKNAVVLLCDDYYYHIEDDGRVVSEGKNGESSPFAFAAPVAWDADDKPIPVQVELFGSRMSYIIDDAALNTAAYPITIDPTVSTSSGIEWATFNSNTNEPADSSSMYSGKTSSKEWATVLRMTNLNWDGMHRSDTVTGAFLQIKDRTGKNSNYVAAYQLLTDWNASNVTWNTLDCGSAGTSNHKHIAPVMLDCKAGGGTIQLDITRAYRDWKDTGKNYGLLLRRPHVMTDRCYMRMKSPVLYVNYLSHAGIAGWWQYEEMDAGRAGTAMVDIFNGNMVYAHADLQMTGNRMPIGVTHYYNSCLSVGGESNDPKVSNNYHCGTGFRMSVQQHISIRQAGDKWFYVWTDGTGLEHWFRKQSSGRTSDDLEGMHYKLVYTAKTSTNLEKITITDSNHTEMIFKRRANGQHAQWANYWLVEVWDSVRRNPDYYNKNIYTYEMPSDPTDAAAVGQYEGMIKSIADSAKRKVEFAYDTNLRLEKISWPGESNTTRTMAFGYDDNGRLTGIGYHDMQPADSDTPQYHTTFEYENNLLTGARNYDGKRVELHYDHEGIEDGHNCNCGCAYCCGALGDSARVKSMEFLSTSADGSTEHGAKQLFAYGALSTAVTAVTNANSDDGKKLIYQFNASGNVVSVLDELGHAQFIKFDPVSVNKPTDVSKLQRVVINRLAPFSEAAAWNKINAIAGYEKNKNTRRLLGVPTALVQPNGQVSQTISLQRNKTYTASVYAASNTLDAATKAILQIKADGVIIANDAADVEMMAQENSIGQSGWARISRTFEIPKGTTDANVTIELINNSGKDDENVWFGWPQLEEGEAANHVNLLYNADFTKGFSTDAQLISLPAGWSKDKDFSLDADNRAINLPEGSPSVLCGNCLKITSTPKKSKRKLYQVLPISGAKNSVFTLGGWAKALSLPGEEGKKPYFDIAISFRNKNGNKYDETLYLSFNKANHDWQYACRAVLAPCDFTAVRVECVYSYNADHALYTNLFLSREEFGQSFVYDNYKDVISVTDRSSQKTKIQYDSAKNVVSYRKPGKENSVVYTANYGPALSHQREHLPRWEKSPEGVVNHYTYDNYGNTTITHTQTSTQPSDEQLTMGSKTCYTCDGMYEKKTIDSHGAATEKSYDPTSGRLTSVTDAQGMIATYDYDAMDRTTQVVAAVTDDQVNVYRNTYTYENDAIKTVSHNTADPNTCDVTYTFDYDSMGRQTSVKVGKQVLAESVYGDDRSGLLKETRFGNGGKVRFEHDDFDRTTGVFYDNEIEPRYRYSYDAEGRVAKVHDKNLNRTAWTEYDLAGRPIRTNHTEADFDNEQKLFYRTRLGYNKDNTLREFIETVGDTNYKSVFSYDDDDRITQMAFGANAHASGIAYTYDGIGRVDKIFRGSASIKDGKAVEFAANSRLTTAYTYAAGDTTRFGAGATTPLINRIVHGDNGLVYDYTYDITGNILTVKQYSGSAAPAEPTIQYHYDKLGQLIRVDDKQDTTSDSSGTTWVYEYDLGGNILSKKRYVYFNGDLNENGLLETIPYEYLSEWRDRLDSYNNRQLLYDDIGNLIRFDGNTYEWQAGKQLKRIDMRTITNSNGVDATDGIDDASGTVIRITFSDGNTLTQENPETKAIARVFRGGKDITDDQPDAAFEWTRESGNEPADTEWNEAHKGMKQITLTADDLAGNVLINCTLTGEGDDTDSPTLYGTVQSAMIEDSLADILTVTHSPFKADTGHTFRIEEGSLMLVVPVEEADIPAEDEPEVDLEEEIEPIDTDNSPLQTTISSEPENEIRVPDPDPDAGMENGGIAGDEVLTDANVSNVYQTIDRDPTTETVYDDDAYRLPKGFNYVLENGALYVPLELKGTIKATSTVYSTLPDQALEFKYDVNGLRTQKKLTNPDKSTVTTDYILHGDQINHVIVTEVDVGGAVTASNELHFYYDAANRPIALDFDGDKYFYAHNVHNDIAAILDSNGAIVVEYKYNAWGELLAATVTSSADEAETHKRETLARLNPFRYRGYVYDEESGLYYLRNRYYNPELQRFINTDFDISGQLDPLSHNIYTYCLNDPINRVDEDGTWSLPNWAKVAIGTALIVGAAVVTVATAGMAGPVAAAVHCFAAGAAAGAAKGAISGAIGGAVSGVIQNRIQTGSWKGSLQAAVDGAADGYLGGAIGGFITGGLTSKACFIAGTLVHAECGLVPIEEIKADQMVWAEDPETSERALKRVVRTFLNEKDELVHVQVNGETITCTTEHPFYVQGKGWVAAKDLQLNDRLELQNGEDAFVDAIRREKLAKPIQVFNFEVEDFHTYYVGTGCVLVHNLCTSKPDEVHHIVEQCQQRKSGFTRAQIQAPQNKITLSYDVHRKISGYYSSKPPEFGGLRVRDWLKGQSFEAQTEFGWKIIRQYRGY